MPGRVVRRVAKGALGMWTEVHFPNGDRVMVSVARNETKIWKISHRIALFGRETLATLDFPWMMATASIAADKARDERLARGVPAPTWLEEVLDSVTSLVSIWGSAAEVKKAFQGIAPPAPGAR